MNNDPFREIRKLSASEIKIFFEKNCPDVNIHDNGITLLHSAADHSGNIEIIKILISMGAIVNAKDNMGLTPLHYATDFKTAEILALNGADVNCKCNDGLTPLHLAIYRGNIETSEILLLHGADINAKENNGCTPLHGAALIDRVEIAKFLVSKGADVNLKNNSNQTPLDLAMQAGIASMVQYLSGISDQSVLKDNFKTTEDDIDQNFIDVLIKIVNEQGKEPLLDPEKCRAFVSDYAKRDFKKESRLLFKAVEAGVSKAISVSSNDDLEVCIKQQHKKLQDDFDLDPAKSQYVVNILAQVLRGASF